MRYADFIELIMNSITDDWLYDDDLGRYVLTSDISICIQNDRTFDREFYEDWTNCFPDSTANANKFLLLYNNSIVEAFYAAGVDGYRMLIPYPRRENLTISRNQYQIGRIINIPYNVVMDRYDEYLSMARITVDE